MYRERTSDLLGVFGCFRVTFSRFPAQSVKGKSRGIFLFQVLREQQSQRQGATEAERAARKPTRTRELERRGKDEKGFFFLRERERDNFDKLRFGSTTRAVSKRSQNRLLVDPFLAAAP